MSNKVRHSWSWCYTSPAFNPLATDLCCRSKARVLASAKCLQVNCIAALDFCSNSPSDIITCPCELFTLFAHCIQLMSLLCIKFGNLTCPFGSLSKWKTGCSLNSGHSLGNFRQLPFSAHISNIARCMCYLNSMIQCYLSHSLCIFVSRLFFLALAFRIPCPPAFVISPIPFLLVLSTYCLYAFLLYCLTSLLALSLVLTVCADC